LKGQVRDVVIQRIAVLVMYDHPPRDRPVSRLPDDQSTQVPTVGFRDFNEGSLSTGAPEFPDALGADGQMVDRLDACAKLSGGGEVDASHSGVPGALTLHEAVGWDMARSVPVPGEELAAIRRTAHDTARSEDLGLGWRGLERHGADGTRDEDAVFGCHGGIISHISGAGTTLLTGWHDEPLADGGMADLFAVADTVPSGVDF
jgi:hypothetical protein